MGHPELLAAFTEKLRLVITSSKPDGGGPRSRHSLLREPAGLLRQVKMLAHQVVKRRRRKALVGAAHRRISMKTVGAGGCQVWSTGITYIRLARGFVYLGALIPAAPRPIQFEVADATGLPIHLFQDRTYRDSKRIPHFMHLA